MDKPTGISIAALLLVIATLTYVGLVDKSGQPINEPNYVCWDREIKAYCYEVSSTNKTCYTLSDKTGAKRCTSLWEPIPEEESQYYEPSKGDYVCDFNGCVSLN